jgi:hypothetical protein
LCEKYSFATLARVGKFNTRKGVQFFMTFTSKLAPKKLLVGAAVALTLATGATASVSALGDNGSHGRGSHPPVVASQCDHPGYRHFGFANRQDCMNYVASHTPGRGQGNGGNGYGGNGNGNVSTNVFVSISNAVNTAVNVTVNFVTNIFS